MAQQELRDEDYDAIPCVECEDYALVQVDSYPGMIAVCDGCAQIYERIAEPDSWKPWEADR